MSLEDDVKTLLAADVGTGKFATLMTGGIYTYESTDQLGLSRDNTTTAAAFDTTTGRIKPACVVKMRIRSRDGGPREPGSASYRQVVELWVYDDRAQDYDVIDAAQARAFALLDEKAVGTTKRTLRWIGEFLRTRDPDLDALVTRHDWDVRGQLG